MELYIGEERVDLFDINVPLTKQFTDLDDLTKIVTDCSITVKIPKTDKNKRIFECFDLDRTDPLFKDRLPVIVQNNDNLILEGYLLLQYIDDYYNCVISSVLNDDLKGLIETNVGDVPSLQYSTKLNKEFVSECFLKESFEDVVQKNLQYGVLLVGWIPSYDKYSVKTHVIYEDTQEAFTGIIKYDVDGVSKMDTFRVKMVDNVIRLIIVRSNGKTEETDFPKTDIVSIYLYEEETNILSKNFYFYYLDINNVKTEIFKDMKKPTVNVLIPSNTKVQNIWEYSTVNSIEVSNYAIRDGVLIDSHNGTVIPTKSVSETAQNIIGFCAVHQGEYTDFENNKIEGNTVTVSTPPEGTTENVIGEWRSYYQQPYISIKNYIQALLLYINTKSKYNWSIDPKWATPENPFWEYLLLMGNKFNERENEGEDGVQINYKNAGRDGDDKWLIGPGDKVDTHYDIENPYVDEATLLIDNTSYRYSNGAVCDINKEGYFVTNNITIEDSQNSLLRHNLYTAGVICNLDDPKNYEHGVGAWNGNLVIGFTKAFNPETIIFDSVALGRDLGICLTIKDGISQEILFKNAYINDRTKTAADPDKSVNEIYFEKLGYNVIPLDANEYTIIDKDKSEVTYYFELLGQSSLSYIAKAKTNLVISLELYGDMYLETRFNKTDVAVRDIKSVGIPLNTQYVDFLINSKGKNSPFGTLPYGESAYAAALYGERKYSETHIPYLNGAFYRTELDSRRTDGYISVSKILNNPGILEVLLNYCKLFRLKFIVDYQNKNITITPNWMDKYTIEDITVDESTVKLYPFIDSTKFYKLGYEDSNVKYNTQYKNKTGLNYGDSIYSSLISNYTNTKEILNIPTSISSIEKYKSYSNFDDQPKVKKNQILPVSIDDNNDPVSILNSYFFLNNNQTVDLVNYWDIYINKETGEIEGTYIITDDTIKQVNDDVYCWTGLVPGSYVALPKNKFPCVSIIRDEYCCLWNVPSSLYFPLGGNSPLSSVQYSIRDFWENYLNEITNPNNKRITCKAYITNEYFSTYKPNKLVKWKDQIWLVNKISNFVGEGFTDVELLQISNIDNYKGINLWQK